MFYTFTSESVSNGHPDKIADQMSDAILDKLLEQDPNARCACEVLVKNNLVIVAGEINTTGWVDAEAVVKQTCEDIGYTDHSWGFDAENVTVLNLIGKQSNEIAECVDKDTKNLGAGDQGMMFGLACTDTPELMPLPIITAHKLMLQHRLVRETDKRIGPDAKAQVTVAYDQREAIGIDTIVLSTMHDLSIDQTTLRELVLEKIIKPVIDKKWLKKTKLVINPSGQFTQGGPIADAGLTGRKIIVDSYGGFAHHGGGCFSGKDPSKVDRSAAYMARYIAKNLVAAGIAPKIEIQLSYAIGRAEPVSIAVNTFGTVSTSTEKLEQLVIDNFDCRPTAIIDHLQLKAPIYYQTASYGHFGRDDLNLPWEKTDKIKQLQDYCTSQDIAYESMATI